MDVAQFRQKLLPEISEVAPAHSPDNRPPLSIRRPKFVELDVNSNLTGAAPESAPVRRKNKSDDTKVHVLLGDNSSIEISFVTR